MKLEVFKSSYGYYNLRTIDGKPTEEMSNYLKQNGYYWSRNNNCWYPGTSAAKNTEANEKFVEDFRKKFFEPAEQEQKSFGQELFEREQRKTAWREAHGLETKQEHSEENISDDERITYLETLINELREERKRDQEKIARLEFELANNRDEGLADFYSQQEQQQLDDEAEWEKENTLTEEEEQAIIDEHNEIPSEIILDSAEAINTIGEIMEEAAREEEPQAENDFMESSSNEEDPEVEVSPEELSLAKSVLPTSQYVSTLRFSQGEEGNFFKQKLKEIAEVVNKAPKLYETDGAEQHPIVLRYFHPTGTETLVTEIGEDGEAYGFQCLNGDYEMAEWGYLDLNEIKSIRMMEIDYHVEKGMTVERWLYKEQPDMFPQYAKFAEQLEEKSPMDIANETGNDVEAIAKALNNQNENEIIVDSQQLADELFDKVTNRYYEENKDFFDTYEKVKEAHIENESRYVGDARIRHNFEQYHEELVKMQLQELTDIIKEADSQEIASKAATRYFNAFGADRYSYYGSLYSITKLAHYESGKLIYPTPEELQSFIKETYNDLHGIVEEKEQENVSNKSFNFFINDAANLDLGIGAEIEPITGLAAEQAAVKYAELKDKGLSPYIGINIPGDFVFDDQEGQGAGIFTEVNGRPSFYMGDNFVKDLNEYDEHAKNVLAAYKELYEMTDKYILGVERPDFVFEKENEFSGNKEYDFTKPINISERFAIDFVNHGYKENTVRFIDRKNNQITTGQYLVSTIADRKGNSELILDMGVSAWTVDAESMKKAEEICRYYRYNHITITSSFEENIELEAENGERMSPEQLNQWNEEQKMQHSQDAELDDLAEGKQNALEAEYKIMQEISKGLTPDEISLNLAKYKESLVYAQEKSKETWDDFYARNTTGFDTPQTVDEFRQAYEHNKKQFEYDVNKYTGWIKALEEVQSVVAISNSPKLTEEQKKEIYETHLKWQEYLNLTEPRIKQYGEAEMRKLSRENAKEFADEFIKAYESQDEDRLLRMNNAWGVNPYTEGGFDDERDIPRTTFIKYFTDGQNISYESVKQGIIAHCKKQNIENTPVNETNAKLAANIDWTEFTEDVFNKTKEDLKNWKDGEVYASINVGQLSFELVPQNMNDRMELFTNIYYPDLNATYGEDADGVRYDTASGFDIASETFIKMSYEEFKDYFANTVLPSSLDNELTERALKPTEDWNTIWEKLNEEKTVEPEQLTSKKDIKAIREQCREILKKPDSEITEADKVILAQYEGAGGLNEVNRTNAGILNEFYTPNNLVEKVWQIVDAYAPNAKTVLEPSAGVGKFANNRPNNEFTMHELDETSARINKILHPEANVIQGAYQKQFFDEGERVKLSSYQQPKYDVVIGNPPYGKYNDKYKGLGEGKEFDRYEEYFINKGLDALKDENSLLAFVVPSGFLNTVNDKQKEIIASKGKLVDAYRLPVGAFPTTEVGTDIIVMKKDSAENRKNNQWAFNENSWFHMHPEKILGEVMIRTNRFGKEEEYVTVHEGLTVQDELDKINTMLPKIEQKVPELKTYHTLKEEDVKELEIISDEDFSDIVDSIILNDYKNIPNSIRLPNLKAELAEKLGLEKDAAFILKKNATHIRPNRKGGYGQAFDTEEYRRIPEVLRNADFAVIDNVFQNFQIVFDDENDGSKINKLVFNKDELGNYLVTIGKVDRESAFSEDRNTVVAVGVAPTIQTLRISASSTALRASSTTVNQSIAQNTEKSSSSEIIERKIFEENEQSNIPVESISKAFADIYKDSPEKATESTQEFTEALEQMDFHKLGHFMLWGVAGGDEISEPVKAVTKKIFENYTGKSFPVFENIDDEIERRHLTELWFAKNTNVANIDTWNKCYDLHSEQELLEYLVSRGSGIQGGKERINNFFEKNSNDQERIKYLINEYGWGGHYASIFSMQSNNNSKGIKVTAYITNPETEEVTKFDRMVSWKEICNEIKRQRLLEIYLDKPVEKTVSEENNKSQSKEVQQETTKTKTPRAKKEKWNIAKSKGEVMTAQEFSHLYGRDFDEREFPIWAATDWQGNIDLSKLSAEDLTYMEQSGNYVCKQLNKGEPEWTHKVLFTTGDIYAKIQEQRELLLELNTQVADDSTYETQKSIYEKNIALLEASKKEPLDMEHIHFGLKSTLSEEFTIPQFDGDGNEIEVNLQESFILWAQGQTLANRSNWRGYIDFATANISREELGEDISFSDIVQYIDGKPVKADAVRGWRTYRMTDEEKKAEKAERKKEADLKRQARADIANKLFDRYLHEGLESETRKRLENEYNRRFNSYIIPDYSKLPLFVNGMSAYKGESKFKLYEQQIKGISFLCNKGNGLLAYDVGVGKTAAGIVATVNQIQTVRSKRPLIIVPNQVYSKWYTDIKQLFPNVKVNDLYNFNKQSVEKYIDSENPHKLNIPENSISLCTYEALKNITFTDESCENELYKDFANLLSADMDGSDRENAESSDKIKGIIGSASHVKDESYYFFEDCGFDHLTVDEAHNFKNLWVVPRPKKKGESNEYSGIPSGKPSARALKMYGMTQLVQEHNDNRNVFMLTATPFTNSPTEVYSMLSYIGRERLHQAGIPSLRSFFDQFAQTKQELGVTSNGEIDTKQVMKNWKELPALQNILTEFIDKVDGEEAGIVRPNKFTHVKPLDMSELQHQMREMDEERMAEVKEGNSAAVIVAMNNMRLSCVAPALANPDMYEGLELPPLSQLVETSPKLKFVCDAIIDMYKDNPEKGQFMYIPLGKESHGIIKDYLVQHGIPKEAVEIINGDINNSPEKKEKITSKFNDEKDKLKIIIGGKNTSEGIDLNGNSFVMYNCSLGWNPSETIQAEGRIWRQGNLQGNVHIVYPVMNDSIDSVLYQKHDEKRSRINELWNYKGDSLNVEEINPEDLKLDLIKDPQKKAKLILEEETKDIKSELSKINLKIKDFDEIIEKRKQLSFDFGTVEDNIERYEKMVNDYKDRNLEVPEWVKVTLKNYKKEQDKANYQKENIEKKLTAWNLETEEDEAAYINNLNSQKRDCEDKITHIVETMPEILQKLEIERMEQKVMQYPVAKQREILESDILNNLRPMKEVEYEIKTERHNKMLAEMLKAGDITKEQHDLYKAAGYENYEKWLNGEIDSLEEKPVEPSVQSENEQSREVEEKTPAVTDEYGFEVFGEEEPSHIEKTENVNSENKNTSDNSAHTNNSNNQSDNLGDLFSGVDNDDLYVKSPEQQYFNFDSDDKYLTPEQLTQAEQKRDEIILPILNGKESGMYNAFNTFAKKGLFDVVGTKIDIEEVPSGEPMISSTGWKQLQAAMNIYREKRFESFRYVFIDRDNGEIRDQMAITCHMPNLCKASFDTSSEGTINKLIERAEQTNTLIVAVHNHPSGNTEPSYEDNCTTLKLDEELKTSDGKSLFAGHIILDHDTFSTWEPHRVNGWIQSDILEQKGKHDELLKDNFAFTGLSADNTSGLLSIADKINDVNNWNDDFIPVVFTNPQREVTGLKLYDKSFFNKEPQAIRNEFQFSGFEAGASSAFPVLTEDFMNKLGGADRFMFEEKMKDLVLHNAFTDAALPDSTIVQKYDIHAGMSFFTSHDLNKTIPEVKTTWEHRVNPTLYEQLKMGTLKIIQNEEEPQKKNPQDLSHLKKAAGMGY